MKSAYERAARNVWTACLRLRAQQYLISETTAGEIIRIALASNVPDCLRRVAEQARNTCYIADAEVLPFKR